MTANRCHPLSNVCLLLNAVGNHLHQRNFMSSTLTEDLLPANTRIIYKSAAADETREDALPIVAYEVDTISLAPYQPTYSMIGQDATTAVMSGAINFTISTTNEALTSELALEIGGYCMGLHKALQEYGLFIAGVTVGSTKRGSAGYFDATVVVQSSELGRPTWQHTEESDILREIGISLNIH